MAPLPGSHLGPHGRALWKLTAPWTPERAHRAVENAQRFPRASTGPFPSNHPRKTPKGPKIALGNPDRPICTDIAQAPEDDGIVRRRLSINPSWGAQTAMCGSSPRLNTSAANGGGSPVRSVGAAPGVCTPPGSPSRSGAAGVTLCSTTASSRGATTTSPTSTRSYGWTGWGGDWNVVVVRRACRHPRVAPEEFKRKPLPPTPSA